METDKIARNKEFLREKITQKRLALERSKVLNQELRKLNAKKADIEQVKDELEKYIAHLLYLKHVASAEEISFRDRRVKYLNDVITEEIQKVFPHSGMQARISYNDKYNKAKATLHLVDADGNPRKPRISEGKLCQYLISFAAVNGVVKSLGFRNIYVDEAFGVSSMDNLPRIGEILNQSIVDGMQIVLVSQNPALYEGIPRREIHLCPDTKNKRTTLGSVNDY